MSKSTSENQKIKIHAPKTKDNQKIFVIINFFFVKKHI